MLSLFKNGYFYLSRVVIALIGVLSLTWFVICSPSYAQTFFPEPRIFEVNQVCQAVSSIKNGTSPVSVNSGELFTVLGENKIPGGTHAFIRIGGQQKWLPLSCGNYQGIAPPPPVPPSPPQSNFAPFFDTEDNPVPNNIGIADATPIPPTLDEFDLAVNEVCGPPGKLVEPAEFESLMEKFPTVLQDIQTFTGNRVFGNEPPITESQLYLERLTKAWFGREGFNHIFCGEPDGRKIGGLHFVGRYLDLQEKGLAGMLDAVEVVPGSIFTIGVEMQVGNSRVSSPVKGYAYTLSASDILKFATRAFADNPTDSEGRVGCILKITDDGQTFDNLFAPRASGIRTFFPDATPNFSEGICNINVADLEPTPTPLIPPRKVDIAEIGTGTTLPGSTNWQLHSDGISLFVDIDTLNADFSEIPIYFPVLEGRANSDTILELISTSDSTEGGFRVYVRSSDGNSITPQLANENEWHINWIGVVTKPLD
ncbi:EndoU domain-containing protein [Crocosphaera sp. Alani8]|uniref:EndoU domain-containing protein n=1 Tax=Crocosphaera sp. Alani8 TaxID=3038952 RepID=UPI00313B9E75